MTLNGNENDHPELSPPPRPAPSSPGTTFGQKPYAIPDPRTLPDDGLGQGTAVHGPLAGLW